MVKFTERLANFEWKKHWKLITICVIILIAIIICTVVIIETLKFKCTSEEDVSQTKAFTDYQLQALQLQNSHRKEHQAWNLKLNHSLNQRAIDCAKYYVTEIQEIDHSCPCKNGAGENLWLVEVRMDAVAAVEQAVEKWYDEREHYDFDSPEFSDDSEHFTAMIWRVVSLMSSCSISFSWCFIRTGSRVDLMHTPVRFNILSKFVVEPELIKRFSSISRKCTDVGVGYYADDEGMTVVVSLYSPHPNVEHHFEENVFPTLEPVGEKLLIGHDDSL